MSDLVFVPIDGADWRALEAWWLGSEELQRWYAQPTPEHFAYVTGEPSVFARVVHEAGEPVGFVQVDLEPDGAGYVGLAVKPELWDHGYGKRILRALVACPELNRLDRIIANVDTDNVRSQRCFAGAGFVQQGEQPDKDGCLAFVYTMPERFGSWGHPHSSVVRAVPDPRHPIPDPRPLAGPCLPALETPLRVPGRRPSMEPKIVEKGEIVLVGMVSYGGDIGELWGRFDKNEKRIRHAIEGLWYELHIYPEDFSEGTASYLVAREVDAIEDVPYGMFVKPLPAATWAAFTHRCGVEGYDVLNRGINEWLAAGPYRHARNISLQVYDARFKGFSDPESQLDLLIPVAPKG